MADEVRFERLRLALKQEGLDALVCRLPEHVLMLTGYWPVCAWVYAVFPREGPGVCILPDTEEEEARAGLFRTDCRTYPFGTKDSPPQAQSLLRLLRQAGRGWKRVGWEASSDVASPAWNAAEMQLPSALSRRLLEQAFGARRLRDASALLRAEQVVKTPTEIEGVRRACRIANLGIEEFFRRVQPGASAVELAAAVEGEIMVRGTGFEGARCVRAFAQVAAGPESARGWRPAEVTTARRLEEGEVALLELAVVADGFWCDRTRARVAGQPGAEQREVHELVRRAQGAAIAAVRPGAEAAAVDEAARRIIRQAGRDAQFMHITGHGLGYRYHEYAPLLAPGSRDILRAGMIHSVEPGLYGPAFGGIRIEDDLLVTEQGGEVLAPIASELGPA
jgi:Xaa-Pro aminopeptidase